MSAAKLLQSLLQSAAQSCLWTTTRDTTLVIQHTVYSIAGPSYPMQKHMHVEQHHKEFSVSKVRGISCRSCACEEEPYSGYASDCYEDPLRKDGAHQAAMSQESGSKSHPACAVNSLRPASRCAQQLWRPPSGAAPDLALQQQQDC